MVILLDWIEPWRWVRQLRDWIRFLRSVTSELSEEAQESAEIVMTDWQQRRRGRPPNDFAATASSTDSNVVIPLSQGEWDEPLGLPLCVVCHGVCDTNHLKDIESTFSRRFADVRRRLTKSIHWKPSKAGERKTLILSFSFSAQYL